MTMSSSNGSSAVTSMRNALLLWTTLSSCAVNHPTSSSKVAVTAFSPLRSSFLTSRPTPLKASVSMNPDDKKNNVIDVDFVKTFVDKFTNKKNKERNYHVNSNYYEDDDYHYNHGQYQEQYYQNQDDGFQGATAVADEEQEQVAREQFQNHQAQQFQQFQQQQQQDREFYYDHSHNMFQRLFQDVFGGYEVPSNWPFYQDYHIDQYEQELQFQREQAFQQEQFEAQLQQDHQNFEAQLRFESQLLQQNQAHQRGGNMNNNRNNNIQGQQQPFVRQNNQQKALYYNNNNNDPDFLFQQLHQEVCGYNVRPEIHLTTFDDHDGVRGVATNRPFEAGETIVRIPISSCLRANEPLSNREGSSMETGLLAASIIQQFRNSDTSEFLSIYKKLLPSSEELKFFLPVRWSPQEIKDILPFSGSRRLQFGLDTARNRRDQHVKDVFKVLGQQQACTLEEAHIALDLVQSRACRVTLPYRDGDALEGVSLPLMAPLFDFINHGDPDTVNAYYSIEYAGGAGDRMEQQNNNNMNRPRNGRSSNQGGTLFNTNDPSTLPLEDYYLTIKAYRPLMAGEQVLLDYGSSARPSWQCLLSYGFVPNLYGPVDENEKVEINVDGEYFEVTARTIPYFLVAHLARTRGGENLDNWDPVVAPPMAMDIIDILDNAAYELGKNVIPARSRRSSNYAAQSIADLRYSQQRILLHLKDALERHSDMMWRNWNMNNWQVDKNDEVVFPVY